MLHPQRNLVDLFESTEMWAICFLLLFVSPSVAQQKSMEPLLLHSMNPGSSNIQAMQTQYETLPYPPRNPDSGVTLTELRRDIAAGLQSALCQALMVGDGTGDGTLELATLLRDLQCPPSLCQAVYVDLSRSSMQPNRPFWAHPVGPILPWPNTRDLTTAYHSATASGVVHHQVDPSTTLQALAAALEPTRGVMAMMVYAPLGRAGIKEFREMASMLGITAPNRTPQEQVAGARALLKELPASNALTKRGLLEQVYNTSSDSGLFDTLLHSHEVLYSVPELAALAESAGMRVRGFKHPALYEPSLLMDKASPLYPRLRTMSMLERAALSEKMHGTMKKHVVVLQLASSDALAPALSATDAHAVPVLANAVTNIVMTEIPRQLHLQKSFQIGFTVDGIEMNMAVTKLGVHFMPLLDGKRNMKQIFEACTQCMAVGWNAFMEAAQIALNGLVAGGQLIYSETTNRRLIPVDHF